MADKFTYIPNDNKQYRRSVEWIIGWNVRKLLVLNQPIKIK